MRRRRPTRRPRTAVGTRRLQPRSPLRAHSTRATRAALATFNAPVLLLAGEVDLNSIPSVVAELAELFPNAELVVAPGAGHFPWLDDADRFVATTATFLG